MVLMSRMSSKKQFDSTTKYSENCLSQTPMLHCAVATAAAYESEHSSAGESHHPVVSPWRRTSAMEEEDVCPC
jgi:hypothetical protein